MSGIAFAMVTLAFAQAGQVLVQKNPDQLTGGEEGVGLVTTQVPDFFVGVVDTRNVYWLALAVLIGLGAFYRRFVLPAPPPVG